MTRVEVKTVVTEVLVSVVEAVGAVSPSIQEDTRLIGTLPNFDSVLAEDTTVELFERLGLPADHDVNPFISGDRAATLGEVVDVVLQLVNAETEG